MPILIELENCNDQQKKQWMSLGYFTGETISIERDRDSQHGKKGKTLKHVFYHKKNVPRQLEKKIIEYYKKEYDKDITISEEDFVVVKK